MEEREQNKLCHLFMGDLGDESERKKAGKHYQAKLKYGFLNVVTKFNCAVVLSKLKTNQKEKKISKLVKSEIFYISKCHTLFWSTLGGT